MSRPEFFEVTGTFLATRETGIESNVMIYEGQLVDLIPVFDWALALGFALRLAVALGGGGDARVG